MPLRFDIFSVLPDAFRGPFDVSIIRRARDRGLVDIAVHDPRDWTTDRHRTTDDTPYGGGAGMVMTAPPLVRAVEAVLGEEVTTTTIVLLSASGRPFTQAMAQELATRRRVALICGHYEGIDDRVSQVLGAGEVSIGDYVLTGGELPAMVIVDAVTRLLPGAIAAASAVEESHAVGLVEYPHYTRPLEFRGLTVPEILRSGHHAAIAGWRRRQAIRRTKERRPDLYATAPLSEAERAEADAETAPD